MRDKLRSLLEKSGRMFKESYLIKNHQDILTEINNYSEENNLTNILFKQQVYHFLNDIKEVPICKNPSCNNTVNYRNSSIGYYEYCSYSCIGTSPEIIDKKGETSLINYGNRIPQQTNIVKEKAEKTNIKKYGSVSPLQNEEVKEKRNKKNLVLFGYTCPLLNDKVKIKSKKTIFEIYGCYNVKQNKEIQKQIDNTNFERYGTIYPMQNKEIYDKYLNSMLERYGVSTPIQYKEFYDKIKNTIFEKYGFEYVLQNEYFLNKQIETMLEIYGVENAMQNQEIFDKAQHNSLSKKLHECGLYYQASYEKDFLDKYSKLIKIEKGKRIIYNDNKVYYCDFYLPDFDIHIEIKSDYWYNKYLDKNIDKHNECLKLGYQHIFIINKDYEELEKIINI